MASPPDIWHLVFEQTPPALRWLFGILSLGLFSIACWAWRRQERSIERVERQLHARIDREMSDIRGRLDAINGHLVVIARNTRCADD